MCRKKSDGVSEGAGKSGEGGKTEKAEKAAVGKNSESSQKGGGEKSGEKKGDGDENCQEEAAGQTDAPTARQSENGAPQKQIAAAPRRPVSKTTFLELAARQGMFCRWCGVPVVRESSIPFERRLRQNKITLSYLDESGEVRRARAATVDHLQRVADGGGNQISNLVISCFPCNIKRERELHRQCRKALKKLKLQSAGMPK